MDEQRQLELFSALEEEDIAMDMDDVVEDDDTVRGGGLFCGREKEKGKSKLDPADPVSYSRHPQAARDAFQQRLLSLYEPAELAEGFRSDFDAHIRETGALSFPLFKKIHSVVCFPYHFPDDVSFLHACLFHSLNTARSTRTSTAALRQAGAT